MPRLLERLEKWKSRYGAGDDRELERLLAEIALHRFRDAGDLAALHETLLFLRAYPRSGEVARLADAILFTFADRMTGDLTAFEAPEISGVAGTSLTAVFSYEVARRLAEMHPRDVEIAWDRYDEPDRMGPVLKKFLPMVAEDWPVEAHVPYQEWIGKAKDPSHGTDLQWLLAQLRGHRRGQEAAAAEAYDSLGVPLTWRMGTSGTSRSRLRFPVKRLFIHSEPPIRRSEVSLATELQSPPLAVRRLKKREAQRILDIIMDTSAMRYRELYGFSHPDEAGVFHTDAGRGVDIYFFGVPRRWRLPLRGYQGGMFFKNGVPAGYVEVLSLFERADVGFNLYYTFREGESAWIYARLLRLFNQVLGVTCFSVDPYQLGHENPEAVDSGAFWFYRKMGFRPVDPEVARLVAREEGRMRERPGYRSSRRTLEKLASGYMLYGGEDGEWDRFRVRRLAQRLQFSPAGRRPPARRRDEWLKLGKS
jgi:hypothetical protein